MGEDSSIGEVMVGLVVLFQSKLFWRLNAKNKETMYVRLTLLAEVVDPETQIVVRENQSGLQVREDVELLAEEFLREGRLQITRGVGGN